MTRRTLALLLALAGVSLAAWLQPRVESPYYAELPSDFPPPSTESPFFRDTTDFPRVGKPAPGEWLAEYEELGQSYTDYVAADPVRPEGTRRILVLQPLGPFTKEEAKVLEQVAEFCGLYFGVSVRVERPILDLDPRFSRERRAGPLIWRQFLTGYLNGDVLKPRLPPDALAYLGVTMHDLYPGDSWNFVFGQAQLRGRVGVFSLARYFPAFYGEPPTPEAHQQGLRRSMAVLAHESGHMFSMYHFVWFRCLMQGSNSLPELDSRTLDLCPICLRKLQWGLGFDVAAREARLRDFYRRHGLEEDAARVDERLRRLDGG